MRFYGQRFSFRAVLSCTQPAFCVSDSGCPGDGVPVPAGRPVRTGTRIGKVEVRRGEIDLQEHSFKKGLYMKRLLKRGILLLLTLAVLVVCAACGGGGTNSGGGGSSGDSIDTPEPEPTPEPELSAEELYQLGNADRDAGETEKAVEYWEQAAALGHISASYNLGVHYYYANHEDVDADTAEESWQKARDYCERAAETGHADALYTLGLLYVFCDGHVDYDKARGYWEQAAEQGQTSALLNLGSMYANAQGVERDMDKAREYWEQAAEGGEAQSAFNLGVFYESEDSAKALEYYEKAAALGHEQAPAKVAELQAKLNG